MLAKWMLLLPLVVPALSSYVDHNRVLLVFDATPPDGRMQRQLDLLSSHSAELKERDLVVIPDAGKDEAMREKYRTGGRFTVILIGKDGGEKLRENAPISYEKLASTIDAMPMRQDEVRRQK